MTFAKLLKKMGLSADVVAQETGVSARMFQYLFTRGTIPYVIVYKLSKLSGIPIEELIPEYLSMQWEEAFFDRVATRGKRGRKAEGAAQPIATDPPKEKTLKERVDALPDVPRGALPKSVTTPIPESVTPKKEAPKQLRKGKSIADIMKSAQPAPEPSSGTEPDFSKVSDDLFSTSAAGNALKKI